MDVNEIKSSGLLELYVLGRLDPADTKTVEDALVSSAALREEVQEISRAFESYARVHGVMPNPQVKADLLKKLGFNSSGPKPAKGSGPSWLSGLLGVAALALAIGLWWQNSQMNDLREARERDQIACDSLLSVANADLDASQNQIAVLNQINNPNNEIVPVSATDRFPETDLFFHHNPVNQRNFIQVRNLPPISADQSYQLWSLKGNQAPIPMDVFRADDGSLIIPVRFEANTNTYAITIEQLQGAQAPNLENLIGTFSIS